MYEVTVQDRFCAAHAVECGDGQMEALHDHDWMVEVHFAGPRLDHRGILVDFVDVQQQLRGVLEPLRGATLNDHAFLEGRAPSAENLARCFFERLSRHDWRGAELQRVTVHEEPGCSASYGAAAHAAAEGSR